MEKLIIFTSLIVLIFLLRGIYNFSKMITTGSIRKKYVKWATKEVDYNVFNLEPKIKELLINAKIEDHNIPYTKPMGMMGGNLFYAKGNYSVISNIAANNNELNIIVAQKLLQAKSVYRYRALQSFNPLFWLETIILLPKVTLNYLNIQNNLVKDTIQILYWIIGGVATLKGLGFNIDVPFLND